MKIQYNVKFEKKDLKLAQKISDIRGENTSDFIRMALRKEFARLGFLSTTEMKALEVIKK